MLKLRYVEIACADKPNGWLGMLLGSRLWYGFFGRVLETDKAFEDKMTEMMREVDQNLSKLGMTAPTQKQPASADCSNPKPVSAPASEPAPAPQPEQRGKSGKKSKKKKKRVRQH